MSPRHSLAKAGGLLVALSTLVACSTVPAANNSTASVDALPAHARPLVMFVRVEPSSVAMRALVQPGASLHATLRVFNALPALLDARGVPQPELLASLPALNTDSWRVFPDGTMETTYTLRPNLVWHDGQRLTSGDFAFAGRVYTNKEIGFASQPPSPAIADVTAIDVEHFIIH